MIIRSDHKEATILGKSEVTTGTIALNAETFGLIIKGIYKDPLLASCREPIFNAVDAHVEAGRKDVPIKIHTPTDLEPYFSVQDEGLGMSEETVRTIFMTLGDSTKRQSNELVGAKGIGSKAPLSKVEAFNVISVYNGTRSEYLVFMDKGIPKVTKTRSEPSTQHNGITIRFPVSKKDVSAYRHAVASCLNYAKFPFEVSDPITTRMLEQFKSNVDYTYRKDGWTLYIYHGNTCSLESRVVMGHQPYRSEYLESLVDYPRMVIEIPIGDCDINPGREWTIEGDDDGGFLEQLKAFVDEGVSKRGEEIEVLLNKATSAVEARRIIKESGSFFSRLVGWKFMTTKWKAIMQGHTTPVISELPVFVGGTRIGANSLKRDMYGPSEFSAGRKLVLNDANGKFNRIKCNYLANETGRNVYYVEDLDLSKELAEYVDDPFYSDVLFLLSELPKPPKDQCRVSSAYQPGYYVKKLDEHGWFCRERISKQDFKDIKYCIPYDGDIQRGRSWLGENNNIYQQDPVVFREAFGIPQDEDVYMIAENRLTWVAEDCRIITEVDAKPVLEQDAWNWLLMRAANSTGYTKYKMQLEKLGVKMCIDPEVKENEYKVRMWMGCYSWKYKDLADRADHLVNLHVKCARRYMEGVYQRYPLLKRIQQDHWDKPEVVEYIELMNAKKETE